MTHPMIEKAARAAGEARNSFGYRIQLTGLVDGVSTYELRYEDSEEVLTFSSYEDAGDHVDRRKGHAVVLAVLQALRYEDGYDEDRFIAAAHRYQIDVVSLIEAWDHLIDNITGGG